ncbi:hypothetical protein [Streptomyces sp. NPDC052496]|uniref:hypothetical protein n=1 Tax=Streptomyces sp. NPDC052496 TaxID=3154951 RepID=UPI003416CEF1
MAYNIFADRVTDRSLSRTAYLASAYEASAAVNAFLDAGFRVSSDLWGAYVPDAMVTPDMADEFRQLSA